MTSAFARRALGLPSAAFCIALAGCASSPAVSAAHRGDERALARAVDSDLHAGRLTSSEVTRIALAVASREVEQGPTEAWAPALGASHACALAVEPALRRRAAHDDEGAAMAAYVLVDAQLAPGRAWSARSKRDSGSWGAAATRGLRSDSPSQADRRHDRFTADDALTRRAALRASFEARDPGDAPSLLEVVRLDPDPPARVLAARASGRVGNDDVVLRLADRYVVADEAVRNAIVTAWGETPSYQSGGRRELLGVATSDTGTPGVTASGAILRNNPGDPYATSALANAITSGSAKRRALAIALAPLSERSLAQAIVHAADDSDPLVRVSALSRMTQSPSRRRAALDALAVAARNDVRGDDASYVASAALAAARDPRALAPLEHNAHADDPRVRAWAASELAYAGFPLHAAPLLADPAASVRAYAACAILRYRSR